MLINTDHLTSRADYSSFNSAKAAHGVYYHGRGYDYCVSHLVIWLSPEGVSSIDAVSTNAVLFFLHRIACQVINMCTITFCLGPFRSTLMERRSSVNRQIWPIGKGTS